MKDPVYRYIFLSILFLFSTSSAAIPMIGTCLRNYSHQAFNPLVHKVAQVDDAERQTIPEFAEAKDRDLVEVTNRYAATGELKCGSIISSANLVHTNNVIVTSFHSLGGCEERKDPLNCKFSIKYYPVDKITKKPLVDKKTKKPKLVIRNINIKKLNTSGFVCKTDKNSKVPIVDDWSVLTLAENIDEIDPYRIREQDDDDNLADPQITAVNARNTDWFVNGVEKNQKSIGSCSVKRIYNSGAIGTDCDGGPGASGSAGLDDRDLQKPPLLLGVLKGVSQSEDEARNARNKHQTTTGDYDPSTWTSTYTPAKGELLNAIRAAKTGS